MSDRVGSTLDAEGAYRVPIGRYLAYTVAKGLAFGLFAATWVVFLQRERGLSLAEAALVDVTFFVAAALAEVPTGVVADRWGRRTSMAIGMTMMAAASLAWVAAPTLGLIIAAYVVLAVGYTFVSGAEDALLYEAVARAGRAEEYPRLVGLTAAVATGSLAAGSVAGGLLAAVALPMPFMVAAACNVLAVVAVLAMAEPPAAPVDPLADAPPKRSAWEVWGDIRARSSLLSPILYLAFVPLAALLIETLLVQPQVLDLDLPLGLLGVVVMALQLASMAGAVNAARLARWLGAPVVLLGVPAVVIAALLGLATAQSVPALGLLGVISLASALVRPLLLDRLQPQVGDGERATVLSIAALVATAVAAIAQPAVGAIGDRAGLPAAYLALALTLSVATLLVARPLLRSPAGDLDPAPTAGVTPP